MIREVEIGSVILGAENPVAIQSMTNTKTTDVEATVLQIEALRLAGCDLVRIAVPDLDSARALGEITRRSLIPVIADIHFDHRLAIESIRYGASKIRINPGNIGNDNKVEEIVRAAKERSVAIRVGSNSGSIKPAYLDSYDRATALAESVLEEVRLLERLGFEQIVVSAKSSSVLENHACNRYIRQKVDYPIHLGITEAGIGTAAIVKSSAGIGALLLEGIGETIRVSITGDPLQEVRIAKLLLIATGRLFGPELISCPTCGRTEIDVEALAGSVKEWLDKDFPSTQISVAVMGCAVNGVGEGKHANIGIAGTRKGAVIFIKGKIVETVERSRIRERFREILKNIAGGSA